MSNDAKHATAHIWQALFTNLAIAVVKGIAAWFTKSGAMLAEAIHSTSDCLNQVLLFVGINHAAQPADSSHPLGYGRALYFWSFIVALLLFTGGGVFSIAEGVEKLFHPEELHHIEIGIAVLFLSLLFEGYATYGNVVEMNKRRGATPFFKYLKETKDSDLILIFGENAAASGGLSMAIVSMGIAHWTGDSRWDGVGSIAVGLVLVAVAIFLAIEVKSLLIGERGSVEIEAAVHKTIGEVPQIERLFNLITVQQGPNEVLVALKIKMVPNLTGVAVCEIINDFERRLKLTRPEIRWCFVEPDVID